VTEPGDALIRLIVSLSIKNKTCAVRRAAAQFLAHMAHRCSWTDDAPGVYIISSKTALHEQLRPEADTELSSLEVGALVDVLEVVTDEEASLTRARIAEPPGWISLLDLRTGRRKALQAGEDHRVTNERVVTQWCKAFERSDQIAHVQHASDQHVLAQVLESLKDDDDEDVRYAAVATLPHVAQVGDKAIIAFLACLLQRGQDGDRQVALDSLSKVAEKDDSQVISLMLECLNASEFLERQRVLEALVELVRPDGTEAQMVLAAGCFEQCLHDNSAGVKKAAMRVKRWLGRA